MQWNVHFLQDVDSTPDGASKISERSILPERMDDVLIAFSTNEGCFSYRHPEIGSVFIVRLCFYVGLYANIFDFQTKLQIVRGKMKDWRTMENNKYLTQMCSETNTLTGKIYLSPYLFEESQSRAMVMLRSRPDIKNSTKYSSEENSHDFSYRKSYLNTKKLSLDHRKSTAGNVFPVITHELFILMFISTVGKNIIFH